jgi:hypothetical protein
VGVNVTDNVQLPAAATPLPQLFDWEKSPLVLIAEIVKGELPILRSKTVCAGLAVPTGSIAYSRDAGVSDTAGDELAPIFITKASVFPPGRP